MLPICVVEGSWGPSIVVVVLGVCSSHERREAAPFALTAFPFICPARSHSVEVASQWEPLEPRVGSRTVTFAG